MDAGRILGVADRALSVANFATQLERAKNITLGVARGVGDGTKLPDPPVIRMGKGMVDGGVLADQRHEATKGVQYLRQAHAIVRELRAAQA